VYYLVLPLAFETLLVLGDAFESDACASEAAATLYRGIPVEVWSADQVAASTHGKIMYPATP